MTSNYTNPLLSTVELAAVLAGLRLVQRRADGILPLPTEADNAISNILTNGDQTPALTADQIDELCTRLNTAAPVGGDVTALHLYQRTYSGFVRISAIVVGPEAANAYMTEHPGIPCYRSAMCTEWDSDEGEEIGEAKLIDAAAIAEAIGKILSGKVQISSSTAGYIASGLREDDGGDIDAEAADCIVQVAMFDEIRYG